MLLFRRGVGGPEQIVGMNSKVPARKFMFWYGFPWSLG
jgi:hypothetical protein|tara:strand:- start:948 stop:1061 length:114 start_codon:yes stop_codon:yes gene_type:complete